MASFTETWHTGPQDTQIYTRLYPASSSPPRACLIFVHGYIEHIARYEEFHGMWASRGITVFAFDQRGFGRTALDEAKKSRHSAYGKTSWAEHLVDVEWAVKLVQQESSDVPVFLMGHSMGGALALSFATRTSPPPDKSIVSSLAGVISTSPLIRQTTPASKVKRWVGGQAARLVPHMLVPTPVKFEDLSHDDAVNTSYMKDPLILHTGSLRGVGDMLKMGEELLISGYKHWPAQLPVLIIHGTQDKVTSCDASQQFYAKVPATDKTFTLYEGGYHELQNEPDGVKEKLFEDCLAWVEKRLSRDHDVTQLSRL